ncbi:MAG: hypothetical protein V5A16_01375 [Haloplanus sp.]
MRRRAKLWAGVYVGLFGMPDASESGDDTAAAAADADQPDTAPPTDDTATEGCDDA